MNPADPKKYLQALSGLYQEELLERIIPFWLNNAIDWKKGGILSCISDEGTVLSQTRYMWSQLRAIWTFSALCNEIEQRREWLEAAWNIYSFCCKHGRDKDGRWYFAVDENARVVEGTTSIFTDAFAVYGLTELARASGDKKPLELALQTYEVAEKYLQKPGSYKTAPYPLPAGMKSHAVAMLFALTWFELAELTGDNTIKQRGEFYAGQVMEEFLRSDNLIREYVTLQGESIATPQGRAVVPGHAIESMWFIIRISEKTGHKEWISRAVETIRHHLEIGWDNEYQGLFLARDSSGKEPWWPWADCKLWWPHTESLVALLYSYRHTHESRCLSWLKRVHDYAWHTFRRPHLMEWIQKLDRKGNVLHQTVALPVKDPFHLPRALIYSVKLLNDLTR